MELEMSTDKGETLERKRINRRNKTHQTEKMTICENQKQKEQYQNKKLSTKKGDTDKRWDKQKRMKLHIGTWNVRGIYEEGSVENVIKEIKKYDMGIVALQETHLTGYGIQEVDDHILFKSGSQSRRFGTGFIVGPELKETVMKFQNISDRICGIRLRGQEKNLYILNIHAPTEEKEEEVKNEFYEEMDRIIDKIPKRDVIIVVGDANAKVGREEIYREVTGGFSKHERSNDNGLRLIELALERNMKIMSTHFQRKEIHKGTWLLPGRNESNQIDHVLIEEKHSNLITNVRTYRGADSDSDHFLVGIKIKQWHRETKKQRYNFEIKYNINDLQNTKIRMAYKAEIEKKLKKQEQKNGIDEKWRIIEQTITQAMEKHVSKRKTRGKKKWLDEECEREIKHKKVLRMKMLQGRNEELTKEYKEQRKKTKQLCRRKKREQLENQIKSIEEEYHKKEIKNFYKDIKTIRKKKEETTTYIKDKEGNLISTEEEKVIRWRQYFEEILNEGTNRMQEKDREEISETRTPKNEDINMPTTEEIEEIINMMKNNKSPGKNGITKENLKYGGNILKEEIHKIICRIWETEEMPTTWKEALILPIFKKGDKRNCENYRGIALLDVTYKILATLIKKGYKNMWKKPSESTKEDSGKEEEQPIKPSSSSKLCQDAMNTTFRHISFL